MITEVKACLNGWVAILNPKIKNFSLGLPVQSQKSQKIELNQEYPCPCRRKGQLAPIALTEAFGCNRCQQIFVVDETGQVLEHLASSYPYKKAWRWNGHQWNVANPNFRDNYLPIALGIVFIMLVIWLPLALNAKPTSHSVVLVIGIMLLALLPALMVLLAYRR